MKCRMNVPCLCPTISWILKNNKIYFINISISLYSIKLYSKIPLHYIVIGFISVIMNLLWIRHILNLPSYFFSFVTSGWITTFMLKIYVILVKCRFKIGNTDSRMSVSNRRQCTAILFCNIHGSYAVPIFVQKNYQCYLRSSVSLLVSLFNCSLLISIGR